MSIVQQQLTKISIDSDEFCRYSYNFILRSISYNSENSEYEEVLKGSNESRCRCSYKLGNQDRNSGLTIQFY